MLAAARAAAPDVVINCAAYNDVDGAEDAACDALPVNALRACARWRAPRRRPAPSSSTTAPTSSSTAWPSGRTTRSDRPAPLSAYGASKLLGEWFALEAPNAYVLRVESLFGGHPAKSSVDRILTAIRDGQPVRVFADRTVTPSYVEDVTTATMELLARRPAPGRVSLRQQRHDHLARDRGGDRPPARRQPEIVAVKSADVKLRARRPQYCALSNDKLARVGVAMPSWQDALRRYLTSGR